MNLNKTKCYSNHNNNNKKKTESYYTAEFKYCFCFTSFQRHNMSCNALLFISNYYINNLIYNMTLYIRVYNLLSFCSYKLTSPMINNIIMIWTSLNNCVTSKVYNS